MAKIKFRSRWNSFRQLTQAALHVMFWSQSDTEHLDCISSHSPPCNYEHKNCTHHRTKCGHNMFTKSTDFREQFWQKKCVKANSHKQISHIQHVSFKQSDRDSVKLCHIASSHQYLLWLLYLWKKYQLKGKYSSQYFLLIKANWEKVYLC